MLSTYTNEFTPSEGVLGVVLELSRKCWKIAFQDGRHASPSIHNAKDEDASKRLDELKEFIDRQKLKWGLAPNINVVVMYEAGQDGFWICRALQKLGYEALVIDPASIPVERRARRAKTDRLDVIKLIDSLMAYLHGEKGRMHVIRVPDEKAESERHLARDRGEIQKEIGQHRDRISKLLLTIGNWECVGNGSAFAERLKKGEIKAHDGTALSEEMRQRFERECERLMLAETQFLDLEKEIFNQLPLPVQERIMNLQKLKGVGPVGSIRLQLELFWRNFNNRREVGSCVGLVPQPYDSGDSHRDQGISKQGNRRVRALVIEMAWMWLRYQPESAITKWFHQRTKGCGPNKRGKRIAIVAVARRLVIALWRYGEQGIIPEGALLKGEKPRARTKKFASESTSEVETNNAKQPA